MGGIQMGKLLEVKNLKKYYPVPAGLFHAVDNISFSIDEGKTLGVVGESGCGKSTVGKTLLHLTGATSGQIIFDGKEITHANKRQLLDLRKEMQMIFQDPFSSLNPRMCVMDAIAEPFKTLKLVNSKEEIKRRVDELMDTVGIASRFARSYPHELDGGRRQRIGIARALAVNPKFIVCDEPVSALDVSIQAQVLNLLMDLQAQKKLTYMFITHDLSVVKHISDHICVMYLGQIVEMCEAKELFENTVHPYTTALLSAIPEPNYHHREKIILKGEISSPLNPKPQCRFANRCEFAQEACFCEVPELKEILPGHQVACHFAKDFVKK